MPDQNERGLSRSERYAAVAARKLLANRTGHGGGPCNSRRLDEAQLCALIQIAYEAGAEGKEQP